MNSTFFRLSGLCAALVAVTACAADDTSTGWSVVNAGLRTHASNKTWNDDVRVYGNGDMGYTLAYEYHNEAAFWQFLLDWTPDATGRADTDSALTPEVNLIFKDGWARAGLGVFDDIVSTTGGGGNDGWQNITWQFLVGVGLPLGDRVTLDGYVHYPFAGWNRLDRFDFGDLEYSLALGFRF